MSLFFGSPLIPIMVQSSPEILILFCLFQRTFFFGRIVKSWSIGKPFRFLRIKKLKIHLSKIFSQKYMIFSNYGGENLVCSQFSAIFSAWECDYNFYFPFFKSKKRKKEFFS